MLCTLAVDVGTTSVKANVLDPRGRCIATDGIPTPIASDGTGFVYDVHALKEFVVSFARGLDADVRAPIACVAISGVGGSGGFVREDGSLESPVIVWHDARGQSFVDTLTPDQRSLVARVAGIPPSSSYGLPKIASIVAARGPSEGLWLNIEEYLAQWLTGERWAELSLASRAMALDLRARVWSPELCSLAGVTPEIFPTLRPADRGSDILGVRAREMMLGADVRVHVAGHDHMVGGAGAGLASGELLNSTGTTEGILELSGRLRMDEASAGKKLTHGIAPHPLDFTRFASIPTGGAAFAALASLLGVTNDGLEGRIARVHARYLRGGFVLGDVPLVVPHFRGSAPPEKDAGARAVMAGIGTGTTTDDIVLGTFLGLARQFRDVLELFGGAPHGPIKVIGPAVSNPLWCRLKADLLGRDLSLSETPDAVALGAQALASEEGRAVWRGMDLSADGGRHEALAEWAAATDASWELLKNAS